MDAPNDYRRTLLEVEQALIVCEGWVSEARDGDPASAVNGPVIERLTALLGPEVRIHVIGGASPLHAALIASEGRLDTFPYPRLPVYGALRTLLGQLRDLSGAALRGRSLATPEAVGATKTLARTLRCTADADRVCTIAFALVERLITELYETIQVEAEQ